MASKAIYSVVAVVGIAAASGAAWWYQSKPKGPTEITGAAATGAGVGTSTPGASPPAGAASAPRPAGVEVAKVEKMALQDDAQAVGSLRSRQSVMMRPEVAGRIKQLGFTDGARVRKGQVLVQLDDVLQRAEIKQAQAQVSIANANLKRNQELVAQNFVAQRVLEESAANLQVAEAQLALSCARLSRMAVLAPFDGTVGIRNVNIGDFVKDGADLINLEDIGSMYVDFRLPERFQGKLKLQQPVDLTLDAYPGRAFKARIEAIDPLVDTNGRSVGVRAILPNSMGEAARETGRGGPGGPGGPGAGGPGGRPGGAAAGAPGSGGPSAGSGAGPRPGAGAQADMPAGSPMAAQSGASGGRPGAGMAPGGRPGGAGGPGSRPGAGAGAGSGAGARGGAEAAASSPTLDALGCAIDPATVAANAAAGAAAGAPGVGGGGGASGAARGAGRPGGAAGAQVAVARPSGAGAGSGPGAGGGNPMPLRPGMFARVNTVFSINDNALVVPEEAIVPQGGRQFVVKSVPPEDVPSVDKSKLAPEVKFVSQRQEVRLGVRRGGRVEILSGLEEGQSIVVAGQQRLQRDGTPLRVIELGRPPQGGAGPGAAGAASSGASGTSGTSGMGGAVSSGSVAASSSAVPTAAAPAAAASR